MAPTRSAKTGGQDPRRPTEEDRALGPRLKDLRRAAGLTQERLANALGVSYQQVQKYENGASRISGGRLRQAATLLGVSMRELVGETEPDHAPGFAEAASAPYDAATGHAAELLKLLGRIRDPADREMLLRLARLLAKG